jgi:hypothetical protein
MVPDPCPRAETGLYQALLDDQIVKVQSMRASPFVKPLESEVLGWEQLLLAAQVRRGAGAVISAGSRRVVEDASLLAPPLSQQ